MEGAFRSRLLTFADIAVLPIPPPGTAASPQAALDSDVVNPECEPRVLAEPRPAFAFCYRATLAGLELLTERELGEALKYLVARHDALGRGISAERSP